MNYKDLYNMIVENLNNGENIFWVYESNGKLIFNPDSNPRHLKANSTRFLHICQKHNKNL